MDTLIAGKFFFIAVSIVVLAMALTIAIFSVRVKWIWWSIVSSTISILIIWFLVFLVRL